MESVASSSPSTTLREESGRALSTAAIGAALQARYLNMSNRGTTDDVTASKVEARDDAHAPAVRWESQGWRYAARPERNSLPRGSLVRTPVGGYLETTQAEAATWQAEWYSRRSPTATHGPYHSLEHRVRSTGSGGMVPLSVEDPSRRPQYRTPSYGSTISTSTHNTGVSSSQWSRGQSSSVVANLAHPTVPHSGPPHLSRVVIPKNIIIPKEIVSPPLPATNESPAEESLGKRSSDSSEATTSPPPSAKRVRTTNGVRTTNDPLDREFSKLDLLCSATLGLGPLQDNPTGCSCPKSKCIALYCDCFKAGRRCDPTICTCLNCKNTVAESGANGARSKAIQSILARNPRAFTSAGGSSNPANKAIPPGEQACNCIRSRCLKLYCTCFQVGKVCKPDICTCVGCRNLSDDVGGHRQSAIEATLEKRPDAFQQKPRVKEVGSGCACKNNKCIRKYCECFRTKLPCSKKCSCRNCENMGTEDRDSV